MTTTPETIGAGMASTPDPRGRRMTDTPETRENAAHCAGCGMDGDENCVCYGECTCYLGNPDDPTRDEEACAACEAAFWDDPVFVDLGGDTP